MPQDIAQTNQPKPDSMISRGVALENPAQAKLAQIALKMRQNASLSPEEIAFWAGVTPKTVTQDWIKRRGLMATKTGHRTIRIESNAFIIWFREFRDLKKFRRMTGPRPGGGGAGQNKERPSLVPSAESPLTAKYKITEI